jgi:predicted GIY-YIG superfamily endonuclease
MHYVYIVRCTDGSLYTGYARDPKARTRAHNTGRGARYTSGRRPVRLVYWEAWETLSEALRREYELKQWPRARKQALVRDARRSAATMSTSSSRQARPAS